MKTENVTIQPMYGCPITEPRVFGTKDDEKFWCDKPIQPGHPDYKKPKSREYTVWIASVVISSISLIISIVALILKLYR